MKRLIARLTSHQAVPAEIRRPNYLYCPDDDDADPYPVEYWICPECKTTLSRIYRKDNNPEHQIESYETPMCCPNCNLRLNWYVFTPDEIKQLNDRLRVLYDKYRDEDENDENDTKEKEE